MASSFVKGSRVFHRYYAIALLIYLNVMAFTTGSNTGDLLLQVLPLALAPMSLTGIVMLVSYFLARYRASKAKANRAHTP